MRYDCPNAYDIDGVNYILCDHEARPDENNKSDIFHSLCGFQRFCPDKRCAVLTAGYENCLKNAVKPVKVSVVEETPIVEEAPKKAVNKKKK